MTRRRESPAEGRARRAAIDDPATVLDAAARFLEVRPRSVAEVRRRLRDAGYRAELVEAAIGRLADLGMLDDAAFARAWVESRDRARPRGERALRSELRRKGIADELVAAVLEDRAALHLDGGVDAGSPVGGAVAFAGGADEADEAAALRLLERRGGPVLREPDPRKRRSKAYALLARNGFAPDVCAAVATAWLARGAANPEE